MKRSKNNVIIVSNSRYAVISSIVISAQNKSKIDSIIKEEFEIESNVKEHLDVISFRIASVFTKAGYSENLYVRTQKILTGPESVKLLITVTNNQRNAIFEL